MNHYSHVRVHGLVRDTLAARVEHMNVIQGVDKYTLRFVTSLIDYDCQMMTTCTTHPQATIGIYSKQHKSVVPQIHESMNP